MKIRLYPYYLSICLLTISSVVAIPALADLHYYTPVRKTLLHRIGETSVKIVSEQYGPSNTTVYVHLHGDEHTSLNGSRRLLESKGGLLLRIDNPGRRNIRFRLEGRYFTFDPNRIFSRTGIEQTLRSFGRYSQQALLTVEKFAQRLLGQLPENLSAIIALHNNSNGLFSIRSYEPNRERNNDAKDIYINDEHDEDDLFYTTDSLLYQQLRNTGHNTIWQHNSRARKDGSLSVYCGEKNIRYLNCETEHGKTSRYESMISIASQFIYGESNLIASGIPPTSILKKGNPTIETLSVITRPAKPSTPPVPIQPMARSSFSLFRQRLHEVPSY